LCALVLYVCTCAPAILWQDSGPFVYRIWHNDLEGNLGLALAHPLYIMIGIGVKYALPFGDLAHRLNLVSAVFGAVAIANLFLLLRLWLGRSIPAVIGAITLAVSWTFWANAVIAEDYTLFAAQMLAELILLLQYVRTKKVGYLYFLGLLNGLAIANHLWAVFGLACYAVFCVVLLVRRQITLKQIVTVAVLWMIGAAPYEYIVIKNVILSRDLGGTLASAVFGVGWQGSVLNMSVSMKIILENVMFILLNFPTPNFLLLFLGFRVLRKAAPSRGFANILTAMLILHFLFAFRYTVPDRHAFFFPFYCLAAVVIGLGANYVFEIKNRKWIVTSVLLLALLPIPVYFAAPEIARKYYKPLAQRRQRPYRDEYKYWLQPWKTGYRGAERFATEALDTVGKNAVVYAYTTDVHALLYVQEVKGRRSDVGIVSDHDSSESGPGLNELFVADLVNNSVLYVVSAQKGYCPAVLLEDYDFVKAGVLFKVVVKSDK